MKLNISRVNESVHKNNESYSSVTMDLWRYRAKFLHKTKVLKQEYILRMQIGYKPLPNGNMERLSTEFVKL